MTCGPISPRAPDVSLKKLEGAEEALIKEEMRLWRGVTTEEAKDVAGDLRRVLPNYPNSSYGYGLLAEAEHDAKNYGAAAQAAERAVELDPENQHAWLYRARTALKLAEDDPAYYEPARTYLAEVRQIDLDDPRPLILYYESFYQELDGQDLPDHAIIALEQAYEEAGSDDLYRLTLGRQLISEERFNEARVVMQPTLFSGHKIESDDEDDFTPGRLVAALEAQDKALALELINKVLEPEDEEA